MKITYTQLVKANACPEGLAIFLNMLNPGKSYCEHTLPPERILKKLVTETVDFDCTPTFQMFMIQSSIRDEVGWLWDNKILPQWSMKGIELDNAYLNESDLGNTNISFALITNTDLSSSQLNNINLNEALLENVNLSESYLHDSSMINITIYKSNLKNIDLSNSILMGAKLTEVIIKNGNLSNVVMSGAELIKCSLRRADMDCADLRGTILTEVDLSRTSLKGAFLEMTRFNRCTYSDATVWPDGFDVNLHPTLNKTDS